ncbi:MAG: PHP domain-containing protein [Deltaproteobacteria bacterium]|nr:PHP domain-containing protein [Deltaproteobacteria bacterium]
MARVHTTTTSTDSQRYRDDRESPTVGPVQRSAAVLALATVVTAVCSLGCIESEGCLAGDDGQCVPPSPCTALAYSCNDSSLELRKVVGTDDRPPGLNALAAKGDILIGNSRMTAVIDAIGAPHHLASTGGTLIDLIARDEDGALAHDELNQVLQTVGILPDDQAAYTKLELLDESPDLVAVIARGRLDGRQDVHIVTRYEVRPCEPGLRIRTELYHGGRDTQAFFLCDVYWWGDREVTPFVPLQGQGFVHPDLDLFELDESMFEVPFMAAQGHAPQAAAYGVTRCEASHFEGFQSTVVSALGHERQLLEPGDSIYLERFIAVTRGPGLDGAANAAREARAMLFDVGSVVVRGEVTTPAGQPVGGDERLASLLFYGPGQGSNPNDPKSRVPLSHAVPDEDGRFTVRLPRYRKVAVEARVLGRPVPGKVHRFTVGSGDLTLDEPVVVPPTGWVEAQVTDEMGQPVIAELVLTPAEDSQDVDLTGSIHGAFHVGHCEPYLGPPHGGSPACNRVILGADGTARFAAPAGTFYVYATRGPFAGLDRELIEVTAGQLTTVALSVATLSDLLPDGVLSTDLHVHAGASFDSSLPEEQRALTLVASDLQVIAATDHDVVTTYASSLDELGIGDRVAVMPGVETTGQILFLRPPGSDLPQVIGHYNFWPLRANESRPRNGAPDDERVEPGQLFDRMEFRYLTSIGYDPRVPVPSLPDHSPAGQLVRRPGGGHQNLDHQVQEVMNGSSTKSFLRFRTAWHSFLNQGILRAGTANSDAHTFAVEVVGYPRNLVFGGHSLDAFDRERFTADIRAGKMVGTNGPVLQVCVDASDGSCAGPSLTALTVTGDSQLRIDLRAAPWIPVEEIRIVVNGQVVETIAAGLGQATDPFASQAVDVYQGALALDTLLATAPGDAWIVVEAGLPLWPALDLDDDGLVETTDTNGDGAINGADDGYVGPKTPEEDDPRYHHHVIAPGTYSTCFSNPLLIDRDGDGWEAPGLP